MTQNLTFTHHRETYTIEPWDNGFVWNSTGYESGREFATEVEAPADAQRHAAELEKAEDTDEHRDARDGERMLEARREV